MPSIRARALGVAGVLTVDAGMHLLWATGSTWPAPDERALSHAVLGFSTSFAPRVVLPLAVLLLVAAAVCFGRARWGRHGRMGRVLQWGTVAVTAGLAIRAAAGVVWILGIAVESGGTFYWLNLLVYTPMCLALGLATASIARSGSTVVLVDG